MKRSGETRRAKLFYLRDRVGKAVRLTEKARSGKGKEAETPAGAAPAKAEARELAASAT